MTWLRFWQKRRDEELKEEIEAHLAMALRERLENGEDTQQAELAVRREFGNRTLVQEVTREMWGGSFLRALVQDARYALRGMRRSPGFSFVAILLVALGTGANTAIFSLTNTILLRMLPVRQPERLVEFLQTYPGEPRGNGSWTLSSYRHFRDHNQVFSALIGTSVDYHARLQVKGSQSDFGIAEDVTSNYFEVLGVQPALGRFIGPANNPDGSFSAVAVISWEFWQNRFNRDTAVLGKEIIVEDTPATIIGVAPPAFSGLRMQAKTDVWQPRPRDPKWTFGILGRLKPGVTVEQARAEMAVLYRFTIEERTARSSDPLMRQTKLEVESAGTGFSTVRDRFGKPLIALMAVASLLLLITCVNIASLLLARGAGREHEIAIRTAIGASRWRLLRQVLTESSVLSLIGTAAGVIVAYFGTNTLVRILASGRLHERILLEVQPDQHILAFTIGMALVAGLLFGLAPGWQVFQAMPAAALRRTAGAGVPLIRRLFERGLIATQVALSVILLSAAGLFIFHLWNLQHTDLGFRRDHVLLVSLDASQAGYSHERLSGLYRELLTRAKQIPGVRSATLSSPTPLSGAGASGFAIVPGFAERPTDRRWISIAYVAPEYFATLGTPLLAGREIRNQDEQHPAVAVINSRMAQYYFPRDNPLGRHVTLWHVTLDQQARTYEIVGVAGDANYEDIREKPHRTIYLPAFRGKEVIADNLVLRTFSNPETIAGSVRVIVKDLLKTVPVARITTLTDQVNASIVPERLVATLSGFFAGFGILLASIGLYGLLAYTVTRRTNEIGIRLALGATPVAVTRMVVSDMLAMVGAGILVGVPVAVWSRQLATSLIQDIGKQTAAPFAAGVLVMVAGAAIACYLPARRAARVDPMQALRHE